MGSRLIGSTTLGDLTLDSDSLGAERLGHTLKYRHSIVRRTGVTDHEYFVLWLQVTDVHVDLVDHLD